MGSDAMIFIFWMLSFKENQIYAFKKHTTETYYVLKNCAKVGWHKE